MIYCYRDGRNRLVELTMTADQMARRSRKDWSIRHKGRILRRDFETEMGAKESGGAGWPMESAALLVPPKDVPAAKERWRKCGIDVDFNKKGFMILRDPGHRRRVLKQLGWRDWDSWS